MDHTSNHNSSDEMWDWRGDDCGLLLDPSTNLWNVSGNGDDLSYMFDGTTTPVKSCGDLAYQVIDNENEDKGMETCWEPSSQSKRRRMLQFDDEILDVDVLQLCDEDFSSDFLKSKEKEDSLDGAFADMEQWVSGFAVNMPTSASGYDNVTDQSSEGWLADCFVNDSGIHFSTDDMNVPGLSNIQMHDTDSCPRPEYGGDMVQEHPTPTRRNIIFKGKKSFIKTPTKITSSVVLPFAFVKPCGEGAVTLKDINQRILTPPPKSKKNYEDPAMLYPTSAFSGKPIVGKTKIRTEGGKGSITIMRTKD